MMSKSILIIHNPVAGQRTAQLVHAVSAALHGQGATVSLRATAYAGEAEKIVRAERGCHDVIAVAGGDGTLMEVVNGLGPDDDQLVAIIPAGTANVVALELGLPQTPGALAAAILKGGMRRVSTGSINGRRFVFTAGAGFDAAVVAAVDPALKKQTGKMAFVAAAVRTLVGYPFPVFEIEIDGTKQKAAGIIVMNGRYYGGRHVIAPGNQLEEPGFATIVLKDAGRFSALKYIAALGLGRLHTLDSVTYQTGVQRVAIDGPTGERVQVDGDNALSVPVVLEAGTGHVNVVCGEGSVGRGGA
jgi:diacylglycerol kinase (ATP)